MRSFDASLQAILDALQQPTFAVIVHFSTLGLRYTNWPSAITYGGNVYSPQNIVVEGMSENILCEAPSARLTITSLDTTQQVRFLADTFRGDTVTVTLLYLASGTWTTTGWTYTFTADADECDANEVRIRLGSSDAVRGTEVPRRTTQEAGCQFDYKQGGCPYRGPLTTCKKTYKDCKNHFPDLCENEGIAWSSCTGPTTHKRVVQGKPYGGFLGGMTHRLRIGGV